MSASLWVPKKRQPRIKLWLWLVSFGSLGDVKQVDFILRLESPSVSFLTFRMEPQLE
jgi:hypothetical protein